ncbi:uncharacterized protein LOC103317946 isoform X1 [Nasonia vitripennis]|uniref:Uncharacterized protein n=1 Tax=Nasonia vitripennis TaxID=7425 RepID=A0A7M7Q7X9_NASVI|nr:uncharacterized protein LOC103317946 isoform X1 [Nasonia vitripennis]
MIPTPKHRSANLPADDVNDDTSAKPMAEPENLVRRKGIKDSIVGRWLDKHVDKMGKYWSYLPNFAGSVTATLAIFLLGACFRGEWMLIFVHFAKRFGSIEEEDGATTTVQTVTDDANESHSSSRWPWEYLLSDDVPPYVRHFFVTWSVAMVTAYTIYFSVYGALHWYYCVRRHDKAEKWKCQPYKWLSTALERHEIMLGVFSLF